MKDYTKKTIEFYDRNVEEYIENTKNLQDKKWLERFVSYLSKNARILDLGCAYGRDCKFFVDNGFETHGVDLSSKLIERAKSSVKGAKFYIMDILDLKFPNENFDGVWCSATLLHIKKKDVSKALSEIKRVLKKGGILYLNLKEGVGEKAVKDERYEGAEKFYSYFTENEIKGMLTEIGFKTLDFELVLRKESYMRNAGTIYLIARKVKP
ncbi:MAG: class I SAM-dependent methyltransferase [Candidatus Aenigmarchaeota archaeon]|nr:class I SAM-dependent methyltransferase [Candidatus Aenigmarchaeota archaeon]